MSTTTAQHAHSHSKLGVQEALAQIHGVSSEAIGHIRTLYAGITSGNNPSNMTREDLTDYIIKVGTQLQQITDPEARKVYGAQLTQLLNGAINNPSPAPQTVKPKLARFDRHTAQQEIGEPHMESLPQESNEPLIPLVDRFADSKAKLYNSIRDSKGSDCLALRYVGRNPRCLQDSSLAQTVQNSKAAASA